MIEINNSLSTRLLLVKTDAAGNVVWVGKSWNTITNNGLNAFFSNGTAFSSGDMFLSTSTTPATTTDVAMGGTTLTSSVDSSLFPSASQTCSATGLQEFSVGRKFSTPGTYGSVGRGTNTTTGLHSKALIRDTGGTPTTVTLAAGESLDVQYILQSQIPTGLVTGTIGGIDYEMHQWRGNLPTTSTVWRGAQIEPQSNGGSVYGNTSATPAFSGTPIDSTAVSPAGWTLGTAFGPFNSSGSISTLVAPAIVGNTISKTFRISILPACVVPGNVIHGLSMTLFGLHGVVAMRFPNTKPSKTNVQEFRWDLTFSVTR